MDKAPKKTKAVIYTRVSSSRQVDNYSLATQEDICKDFCLKHLKEDVPEERIFREEGGRKRQGGLFTQEGDRVQRKAGERQEKLAGVCKQQGEQVVPSQ